MSSASVGSSRPVQFGEFHDPGGDFALMDNNARTWGGCRIRHVCFGLLPVYPCAWSRAFLGFVEPQEITGENLQLGDRDVHRGFQLIKIPISPQEYFLLETEERT